MVNERVRPTHTLVDWGPAIAGAIIALAISQLLAVLGIAVGATLLDSFEASRGNTDGLSVGGGLWTAFSYLVALQVGAFVATRASPLDDGHRGYLQGLLVWSLVFLIGAVIAAIGVSLGVTGMLASDAVAAPHPALAPAQGVLVEGVPVDARIAEVAEIDAAAEATATIAWWFVIAAVFGLIGALIGGRLGEQPAFWDYWTRTPRAPTPPVTPTT